MVTTIYHTQPDATIHVGDALDTLVAMPDSSVACIVTSPPYWAKRGYGVPGQYGLESNPAAYIATLHAVFCEARCVLADDGTCWLNLGDSYSVGSGTAKRASLSAQREHLSSYSLPTCWLPEPMTATRTQS